MKVNFYLKEPDEEEFLDEDEQLSSNQDIPSLDTVL